jgi:hypothetical protein
MSASGLRSEAARGRVVIERIAGKDYTTLANIERMRELCRVAAKGPTSGSDGVEDESRSGSSSTAGESSAQVRAREISARLKKYSPTTSGENDARASGMGKPTKS